MRVFYLALAIALSVATTATAAPPTAIAGLSNQRKALYQAELCRTSCFRRRRHRPALALSALAVTATALAPSHHRAATAPGDPVHAKHHHLEIAPSKTGGHQMRHPFVAAQLLRQARAAASIETRSRPAPSIIHGRRVPRLVVRSAAILLVATVAVLGIPFPASPASAYVPDERAKQALERTLAREHHAYPAAPEQAAQAGQPTNAVERFRRGERASQKQPTTDDATQRELAERWNYYYQATRMSPAELKAWLQAKERADNPTQVPVPVQPDQPTAQPGWLVVSLGALAAVLAFVAGLALLAARRATRRARVGQAT
jgi:hypothetical protein